MVFIRCLLSQHFLNYTHFVLFSLFTEKKRMPTPTVGLSGLAGPLLVGRLSRAIVSLIFDR